jgi:hypothetical protein
MLEHFTKGSIELWHAELRPRPFAFCLDRRAGCNELCSWNEIREIVCMALTKPAKADDADSYFIHEFQAVPFSIQSSPLAMGAPVPQAKSAHVHSPCKRFLKTFAYGGDIIAQVFESVK